MIDVKNELTIPKVDRILSVTRKSMKINKDYKPVVIGFWLILSILASNLIIKFTTSRGRDPLESLAEIDKAFWEMVFLSTLIFLTPFLLYGAIVTAHWLLKKSFQSFEKFGERNKLIKVVTSRLRSSRNSIRRKVAKTIEKEIKSLQQGGVTRTEAVVISIGYIGIFGSILPLMIASLLNYSRPVAIAAITLIVLMILLVALLLLFMVFLTFFHSKITKELGMEAQINQPVTVTELDSTLQVESPQTVLSTSLSTHEELEKLGKRNCYFTLLQAQETYMLLTESLSTNPSKQQETMVKYDVVFENLEKIAVTLYKFISSKPEHWHDPEDKLGTIEENVELVLENLVEELKKTNEENHELEFVTARIKTLL